MNSNTLNTEPPKNSLTEPKYTSTPNNSTLLSQNTTDNSTTLTLKHGPRDCSLVDTVTNTTNADTATVTLHIDTSSNTTTSESEISDDREIETVVKIETQSADKVPDFSEVYAKIADAFNDDFFEELTGEDMELLLECSSEISKID